MEITNQQRDQAYTSATPEQQQWCNDPEQGAALTAIASEYGITEPAHYNQFVLLVGDSVLNLLPKIDLPTLFVSKLNLTRDHAEALWQAVQPTLPGGQTTMPVPTPPQLTHSTTTENNSKVAGIRTMADDIERVKQQEPVRTLSQEELLQPRENGAKPTNIPRWGSETG